MKNMVTLVILLSVISFQLLLAQQTISHSKTFNNMYRFGVPEPADVTVMIYNILGQEVRELYRGHMQPGYQFMKWDGKDMFGTPGPSGMYIVVMQAGVFMDTKKVILLK